MEVPDSHSNNTLQVFKWPIDICPGIFACNEDPTPGTPIYSSKATTGLAAQLLLCGSVGLLSFLSFCFLRTRWISLYAPRLRMKKHAPKELPSSFFGWIWPLLKMPHSVVLDKVGLDAVVMLQFLLMGAKLFGLCGFFGTVVLLPISRMGGDLVQNGTDPIQPPPSMNDSEHSEGGGVGSDQTFYSPSYLWVYLFFTYFFCFATFYFTFLNYRDYVRLRREFLLRIAKTVPSRTVLVTGIPPHLRSDRKLAQYFEKLGIGVVESVHVIRHVNRLMDYTRERAQYLRLLERAYTQYWGNPCEDPSYDPDQLLSDAEQALQQNQCGTNHGGALMLSTHADKKRSRPSFRLGFLGLFGPVVDSIEYYTERFNEIDALVVKARRFGRFLPTSVGFVTFEHSVSACIASQVLIDSTPFRLRAELAPEPRNVLWENITMHGRERLIRKAVIFAILIFLVFFWILPISYFSALTSERSLQNYFPWLMDLAKKNKILHQIVVGFLPTLAVVIFMAILPLIVNENPSDIKENGGGRFVLVLSVIEGFQSRSEAEESSFSKHFFFLLFNFLLVFTVTSTLFKTLSDMIEDPTQIANILATSLPQVAPFFVNYTVLQCLMVLPIQLLQVGIIILQGFWRTFLCKTPRDYAEVCAPRMFNYGWGYPAPVFMFVVLLVYSTSSPIILVFGTLYFCFAYVVFKYQILYVYFHPYEVAGRMWPRIFSRIIVGLLLFELMSSGLFLLQKAYPLAVLCSPLIILTVCFKLTMDEAYLQSTQVLPLQLLTQHLGVASTDADNQPPYIRPSNGNDAPAPAPAKQQTHISERTGRRDGKSGGTIRRRRTALDQDDYVADPTNKTDFRQPPMTLVDGILNTGMKRYGHPALLGALPQLWLPVPKYRRPSILYSSDMDSSAAVVTGAGATTAAAIAAATQLMANEHQPLLATALEEEERSCSSGVTTTSGHTSDTSSDEETSVARRTMYYHHPERRTSRGLLNSSARSYGATPQDP
ncbi:hypothetical protein BX666DRAFT_2020032 [Dichotomocladium elegans]|nr:hypothetical protein BX666DRAFT_2020032 [Dichotomocladium elegans]